MNNTLRNKNFGLVFLGALIGSLFMISVSTQAASSVVISEVAWMGTDVSSANEWIELYNPTDAVLSLEGWTLVSSTDGKPNLSLTGSIAPKSFYLIERTNDDTVLGVKADFTAPFGSGTGVGLSNTGETLELRNGTSVVDSASWNGEGPGNAKTYQTMERKDIAGQFGTSSNPGGTPRAQNSIWTSETAPPSPSPSPSLSPTPTPTPNQPPHAEFALTKPTFFVGEEIVFDGSDSSDPEGDALQYAWDFGDGASARGPITKHVFASPGNFILRLVVSDGALTGSKEQGIAVQEAVFFNDVTLNEIAPNPRGHDSEGEFIELLNSGTTPRDISGWQLSDSDDNSRRFTIPRGTVILPGAYFVAWRRDTALVLNNSGDAVRFFDPRGRLTASVSYEKAEESESFSYFASGWSWTPVTTAGSRNIQPPPQTPEPNTASPAPSPSPKNSNPDNAVPLEQESQYGEAVSAAGESADAIVVQRTPAAAAETGRAQSFSEQGSRPVYLIGGGLVLLAFALVLALSRFLRRSVV